MFTYGHRLRLRCIERTTESCERPKEVVSTRHLWGAPEAAQLREPSLNKHPGLQTLVGNWAIKVLLASFLQKSVPLLVEQPLWIPRIQGELLPPPTLHGNLVR